MRNITGPEVGGPFDKVGGAKEYELSVLLGYEVEGRLSGR